MEWKIETVGNATEAAVLTTPKVQSVDLPIWEKIQVRVQGLSPREINQLPVDGAEEHDHYLYGNEKRNN